MLQPGIYHQSWRVIYTQTTEQKIESIIEQVLWLDAGLPLPDHFKSDVNKVLATSGLSEEDQRKARRKFRKQWRRLARVMPKHNARRSKPVGPSCRPDWLVQAGSPPRKCVSEERKLLVATHFRLRAERLVDAFTANLSAHEGVKHVP